MRSELTSTGQGFDVLCKILQISFLSTIHIIGILELHMEKMLREWALTQPLATSQLILESPATGGQSLNGVINIGPWRENALDNNPELKQLL
jgi:hypothetical protein